MPTSARSANTTETRTGLAIFLLGVLAGLAMVLVVFNAQSFVDTKVDPYFFGAMGKSLARGDGFMPYGNLIKRRAPLYPLLIGAIYTLFGEHPRLVQLLQCLLLGGTCWLVYDMGCRVFNRRTGILAGVACALHPLMLRYVADLHLETLFTFLVTLTIWYSLKFYERPSVTTGVLLGVAGALASLTKAVFVIYPALFLAVWTISWWMKRRRMDAPPYPFAACFAVGLTMIVLIAPWTIRNYRATNGHFVLISSGFSDAFLRGYVFSKTDYLLLRRPPYTDAENESNAWFRAEARKAGTEWERDDYETDKLLNKVAKDKFLSEPALFVRKFFVGLFAFWYEMTSLPNSLLAGVLALAAIVLAAIGAYRSWQEARPVWLFVLPAIQLNLLLAALLALGRYSVPVMPVLLVASAFGVDTLLSKRGHAGA